VPVFLFSGEIFPFLTKENLLSRKGSLQRIFFEKNAQMLPYLEEKHCEVVIFRQYVLGEIA
jgi:hypothetical protein